MDIMEYNFFKGQEIEKKFKQAMFFFNGRSVAAHSNKTLVNNNDEQLQY